MAMKEKEEEVETKAETQEIEESDVASDLRKAFDELDRQEAAEKEETSPEASEKVEEAKKEPVTERSSEEKTGHSPEVKAETKEAVTETKELLSPPSSWSIETKAKFATLDPLVQKEVLKRETDFHKGIEEYKTDAKTHREWMQVVQPYMPLIQSKGGTPIGAINNLLNTAYQLEQNPQAVIQRLANQYGVKLGNETEQPHVDPLVSQLMQEVQSLKGTFMQKHQQQEQMSATQANEEIVKFASDPKNIYFNDVRNSMASLIQTGEASNMQEAYNKACRMNDKVFAAISEQERTANEQKRILEAKQKAANAKRASFDVSGSGAVTNGKSEMTLRDQLEAAFPQ